MEHGVSAFSRTTRAPSKSSAFGIILHWPASVARPPPANSIVYVYVPSDLSWRVSKPHAHSTFPFPVTAVADGFTRAQANEPARNNVIARHRVWIIRGLMAAQRIAA